ncbi:unnamed protein product, partial [Rotaria magnacalcarata]
SVIPKSAEQCASSLHHHFEEYVNATEERVEQARQAYLSFIRYYASFSREWKYLFHVKNIHRGHVAKSFGLKSLPDESNNHTLNERKGTFASLSNRRKPIALNDKKPTETNDEKDDEDENDEKDDKDDKDEKNGNNENNEEPTVSLKTEKKSLFDRPLFSYNIKPRPRFRNFSHISEYGNGLELITKSHK